MIKFKKILSLVLVFVLLASVCTNGSMPVFAVGSEPILTAVPADVTPTEESLGTQVAYIANDTVTVYEYYENGALGMVCTGALGEQIELTKKFTYTVDGVDTVIYHFADSDFDGALGEADDANYQFILASDVTFTAPELTPDPEPTETVIPDSATGVSVAGDLPDDVTLTVTEKTLAESGIDTTTYPISGASLFYDVTLLKESTEYQPENGITVTFPEAAITNSGLTVGDSYNVYHIHDGVIDMSKPAVYNGGSISVDFANLSVVGIAQASDPIDLVSLHGIYTEESVSSANMTINKASVTLYDSFENNVYTAEISSAEGTVVDVFNKVTFADGFTLYQYAYYGTDAEFVELSRDYPFISAEDLSVAGIEAQKTLTDEDYTGPAVSVSGKFESGVELSVETATLADVMSIDQNVAGIPEDYIGIDISLLKNDVKVQPGESVTVSLDVSHVAFPGDDVLIYHAHRNDDNTVTSEVLGPFTADSSGCITFAMSRFSYLLVFNADYEISGVEAFYPGTLEGSDSTNDQLTFLGVYYDTNNVAHFLLAFAANSNATNAESKFEHVTIDATTYYKDNVTYSMKDAKFSNLILKDENGNTVYTSPASDKKGYGGVFDITLGDIQVRDGFFFGVNNINTGNGWRIGGNLVLDLDYELIKTVAAGTSATDIFGESVIVDRGDWVIFKINVNNKGDRPLTDMLVKDILPEGVFDMSTVQMSIDGVGGAIGNWEPFNSTLFSNYDSEGHFSRLLYIKAQVDPDLSITTETTYTNKATIDGMNMPTYEDTASVIVKAPTTGTLTVSKAVTSENPNDPAPDTPFTFTVHSNVANAGSFSYTKSDGTTGSVANDGTFTLKNGESIEFSNFPVGDFTITETKVAGYNTKINGAGADHDTQGNPAYSGSMTSLASPVVAFENQFATRMATLSISKKVEQEYPGDTPEIPADGFEFTVVFGDGTDTTTSYPYTKSDGTTGTITSGGTIKLGYDQTAVFSDIPVGTKYNITEILGELADDYVVSVNGNENVTSASGTMQVGSNVVTVVNTYTQHFTDLTITKTGAQMNLDENQSFIFDVVGPDGFKITVTINGNGSVTIKNVPFGTYTVTEQTEWSWRYNPEEESIAKELNSDPTLNYFNFSNNRTMIYWLSGDSYCKNWWGNNGNVISKDDEE